MKRLRERPRRMPSLMCVCGVTVRVQKNGRQVYLDDRLILPKCYRLRDMIFILNRS